MASAGCPPGQVEGLWSRAREVEAPPSILHLFNTLHSKLCGAPAFRHGKVGGVSLRTVPALRASALREKSASGAKASAGGEGLLEANEKCQKGGAAVCCLSCWEGTGEAWSGEEPTTNIFSVSWALGADCICYPICRLRM